MSKIEVNQVDPQSGTTLTLGTSGDTVSIPSGVTLANAGTVTGIPASAINSGTIATARLGTGTADATTFLRGDQTYATVVSGLTMADQWRLSGNISSDSNPITSNLEQVDTAGQGTLGTAMTQSSGVFTFPSTGIYKVEFIGYANASGSDNILFAIMCTTNNSSYVEIARNFYGVGGSQLGTAYCSSLVDVTDTSNVKVSFQVGSLDPGSYAGGDTARNQTTMTFIRLGDT